MNIPIILKNSKQGMRLKTQKLVRTLLLMLSFVSSLMYWLMLS